MTGVGGEVHCGTPTCRIGRRVFGEKDGVEEETEEPSRTHRKFQVESVVGLTVSGKDGFHRGGVVTK